MCAMLSLPKKRLPNDIKLMKNDPIKGINAYFEDNDMYTWFFLIFGPDNSEYAGGEYIGKVMFDNGFPLTPPDFMMHTPNGRFEPGKKICLTTTKFHTDEWKPTWTIHGILNSFLSVMLEDKDDGISHIKRSAAERKVLATKSIEWNKKNMAPLYKKLKEEYLGSDKKFPEPESEDSSDSESSDSEEDNSKKKNISKKITKQKTTPVVQQKKNDGIPIAPPLILDNKPSKGNDNTLKTKTEISDKSMNKLLKKDEIHINMLKLMDKHKKLLNKSKNK
jgi:ubiquitin-protein ligase